MGALLCLTRFSTDLPNDLVKRYLNDEHYNKAEDELSEYLMKNDFLAEDHVSFKLNIPFADPTVVSFCLD